jgi:hypothetical protein
MALSAKDRLIRVQIKIERAKQHLLEFDGLAKSFQEAYREIVVSNVDFTGGPLQMFGGALDIRRYPVASFKLLAVAGDIVQNLRSALDHLAYQLAEVGTPGATPSEWVAFPIVRDAKDYESAKARKVQGMTPEAIKAIDALKPYKGGNDELWRLHELSNIDKHRFAFTLFRDGLFLGDGFEGHYWLRTQEPLFDGIMHPEVNGNAGLSSSETMSPSKVGKAQPLLPFLHQIVDFVDALVNNFLPHLG